MNNSRDFQALNTTIINQLKKKIWELNEEKEKLQTIFDSANDGMLIAGIKTKKFHTGNKAICRMLGYNLNEIKKLGIPDIHPKKDLPYVLNQVDRQIRREIEIAKNLPVKRKNGEIFYADVNASLIIINGKPSLLGIFRDVTKSKKAEEALKEEKERYIQLFEQSNDAIVLVTTDGKIFGVNKKFEEISGFSEKDTLNKSIINLMPSSEKEKNKNKFIECLKKGKVELEAKLIPKKGGFRDIEIKAKVLKMNGGLFIQSIIRDITERKKADEKLKEIKEKYKSLVETTSDWIWELDKNGEYTYASPKVKEILGYRPGEVIGKTPFDLMPKDESKRIGKIFREFVKKKEPFSGIENWNIHKNGTKILLETSGVPILNEKGDLEGYRGIDRRITERKKMEEELIKQKEKYKKQIRELKKKLSSKRKNEF